MNRRPWELLPVGDLTTAREQSSERAHAERTDYIAHAASVEDRDRLVAELRAIITAA